MKLPKELTTVTPLSKYLALFLLIALPFIGFYLGMRYQEQITNYTKNTVTVDQSEVKNLPINNQDASTEDWKTFNDSRVNYSFQFPPTAITSVHSSKIYITQFYSTVIENIGSFGTILTIKPHLITNVGSTSDETSIKKSAFTIEGNNVEGEETLDKNGNINITLNYKNYDFLVSLDGQDPQARELISQILSTFKFTD